jgi:hypothetical protein
MIKAQKRTLKNNATNSKKKTTPRFTTTDTTKKTILTQLEHTRNICK